MVADIGFQPGVTGPSAAALIDQSPAITGNIQLFCNQTAGFFQLFDVIAVRRHRQGNAVRRERDCRGRPRFEGQGSQRRFNAINIGRNESGVVVKYPDFINQGSSRPRFRSSLFDVLAVLSASGVRAVG